MSYPTKRNLDGMYFRLERNGNYENVCITDMTDEEFIEVIGKLGEKQQISVAKTLRKIIRDIGEQFDIIGGYLEED